MDQRLHGLVRGQIRVLHGVQIMNQRFHGLIGGHIRLLHGNADGSPVTPADILFLRRLSQPCFSAFQKPLCKMGLIVINI